MGDADGRRRIWEQELSLGNTQSQEEEGQGPEKGTKQGEIDQVSPLPDLSDEDTRNINWKFTDFHSKTRRI